MLATSESIYAYQLECFSMMGAHSLVRSSTAASARLSFCCLGYRCRLVIIVTQKTPPVFYSTESNFTSRLHRLQQDEKDQLTLLTRRLRAILRRIITSVEYVRDTSNRNIGQVIENSVLKFLFGEGRETEGR